LNTSGQEQGGSVKPLTRQRVWGGKKGGARTLPPLAPNLSFRLRERGSRGGWKGPPEGRSQRSVAGGPHGLRVFSMGGSKKKKKSRVVETNKK